NKNYVKKFVGNYCSFGPKEDAKAFTSEEAEQMRKLLENSVGNAFVIDDDRVLSQGG
ncbi:TPA: UDP-3-O-acyl-N-acetylglucosamine deacetylase, partial [Enterococcus faecalis]|nr:UDP-3-O-acyl-N-acetylglucosamine deacetylase [Enterococcus faecalis]HAP4658174.1 UDP-3-O-acyl-N-acetylglucosamine deacetylase [Enterococcus faecalis]HAP4873326.1 UDP-3-O-acyl-N-acetylglucosamine deacetylase [Enterococcus faecalis]HAP5216462.1 UDP-3-O-acyl-N-acetylglucosamine deacetylase [Enterococcus faecalis]HAP5372972.1 UDP-3-O-acyl-N-acetylglucosamine deacetylase [Enterococcus faecalis]